MRDLGKEGAGKGASGFIFINFCSSPKKDVEAETVALEGVLRGSRKALASSLEVNTNGTPLTQGFTPGVPISSCPLHI